jgi:hypothetical protein
MGSGGTQWETDDLISVARMNQKNVYVGSSAPSTTYAGMLWFDTTEANNKLMVRNWNDTAWIDFRDASLIASGVFNAARVAPDVLTTQGDILIRGVAGYERLGYGTSGQFLKTQGVGANPIWANTVDNEKIVLEDAERTNATTTIADVTGLSFSVGANETYLFEFFIIYQSSLTAYGPIFSVNGPTSPTRFVATIEIIAIAGTAWTSYAANGYDVGNANFGAGTANVNGSARVKGIIVNAGNAGTLTLRFKCPTSGHTIRVEAGSVLRYRKLN